MNDQIINMKHFLTFLLVFVSLPAVAQWHRLPGPPAWGPFSYTQSSDGKHIYAATLDGIWQSSGVEGPWTPFGFRGKQGVVMGDFPFSGQDIFFVGIDTTLWRSIDTGRSWQVVRTFSTNDGPSAIFQDGEILTLATNAGIIRSTDVGTTWGMIDTPPFGRNFSVSATPKYYFAGTSTDEFLWRIPRAGGTWLKTSQQAGTLTTYGKDIFLGMVGYVMLSTDDGSTWIRTLSYGLDTTKDMFQSLAVNGLTIVGTFPTGVFTSTDGARSWFKTMDAKDGYAAHVINDTFVISTGAGLFASIDGKSWKYVRIADRASNIMRLTSSNNSLFAITDGGAAFHTSDRGNTWSWSGNTDALKDLVSTDGNVFALGSNTVSLWSDTGWNKIDTTLAVSSFTALRDTFFLSDGTGIIYRSEDRGGSWHQLVNAPSAQDYKLFCVDDTVFALAQLQLYDAQELYVSPDRGETWTLRHEFPQDYNVIDIAASQDLLAIQLVDHVGFSRDHGNTWTTYHEQGSAVGIVGSHVIAGLTSQNPPGFYDITNGLRLIKADSVTSNIYSVAPYSIASDDSMIYIGTAGYGLWANEIDQLPLSVRTEHQLSQMPMELYPNPTRATTTLHFELSHRGDVRLDIFNALGETVSSQDMGTLEAGSHDVPVETTWLASGMYSVRISTDNSVPTARLIVSH